MNVFSAPSSPHPKFAAVKGVGNGATPPTTLLIQQYFTCYSLWEHQSFFHLLVAPFFKMTKRDDLRLVIHPPTNLSGKKIKKINYFNKSESSLPALLCYFCCLQSSSPHLVPEDVLSFLGRFGHPCGHLGSRRKEPGRPRSLACSALGPRSPQTPGDTFCRNVPQKAALPSQLLLSGEERSASFTDKKEMLTAVKC